MENAQESPEVEQLRVNPKRAHSTAGTSRYSSGASFAQELRAWWYTQKDFARQSDFAAALGVSPETLQHWLTGRSFPSATQCDGLYSRTQLNSFGPGRDTARLEHERKRGLSHAGILKRAQRQYVSPKELAECRADPRKAFTIRGDDWIVCLECGQLLKQIRGEGAAAHLSEHGLSAKQYRDLRGYSKSTGLVCNALAAKKRTVAAATGNLKPEAGRGHLRPPAKGRVMSREFSLKQADRMRGTQDLDRDTTILRLWLLESRSIEEIAGQVGLSQGRVHVILQRIFGMRVKQTVCFAHGQILTAGFVEQIAEAFDLKKKEIARVLKISVDKLQFPVSHRDDRALTPEAANFCLKVEKDLLDMLLRSSSEKPNHFQVVVPGLHGYYNRVIEAIRLVADKNLTCLHDLCARAQETDREAVALICILPCLLAWLKKNAEYSDEQPFKLAQRFISHDYGVSVWIVERTLKLGPGEIDARDRKLVRVILLPKKKEKPGPDRKDATEKRDFEIRDKLAKLLPIFSKTIERKKVRVSRRDREDELRSELLKLGYSGKQIERGLELAFDSKDAKVASRHFISGALHLQYSTVKGYDLG